MFVFKRENIYTIVIYALLKNCIEYMNRIILSKLSIFEIHNSHEMNHGNHL